MTLANSLNWPHVRATSPSSRALGSAVSSHPPRNHLSRRSLETLGNRPQQRRAHSSRSLAECLKRLGCGRGSLVQIFHAGGNVSRIEH